MRRTVTGHTGNGKSVFVSDGEAPRVVQYDNSPRPDMIEMWATDALPVVPARGDDPTIEMASFVPGPGGTRFRIVQFTPQEELAEIFAQGVDPEARRRESLARMPGLAEAMEPDNPGMHTTDTVDYGVVISGEIWLELDDGAEVHLKQGDCVVQNGTRHAWRNKGSELCLMAFVMVGAERR